MLHPPPGQVEAAYPSYSRTCRPSSSSCMHIVTFNRSFMIDKASALASGLNYLRAWPVQRQQIMVAFLRGELACAIFQFKACQVRPGMQDPVGKGCIHAIERCCEMSLPVCSTNGIKFVKVLAQSNEAALHRDPGSPFWLFSTDVHV